MKGTFSILLILACTASAAARTIEPAEAEAVASGFMQRLNPGPTAAICRAGSLSGSNAAPQPYYIYNYPRGGYVIVAGDDRMGAILAYSTEGAIEPDAAPAGLNGLLAQYATLYHALPETDGESTATTFTDLPTTEVAPLLGDICWGQDTPFNLLTPTYTSGGKSVNYYTGCVACAATQIMRMYMWPAQGTGSKTYTDPKSGQTLSADFGATTYDWAHMPAAVPMLSTMKQQQAYSTLAYQMGVALEMQYEASGSGTYDMLVPYALRTYFGYDKGVRSHNRTYYPTSEWMQIIKDELQAGRPVFYGGTSDTGTGGHAFVIDGYDSEGFVHVNWGWYGNSNGYFMINHLDPSSLGEGGGAGGYNLNQDMITGIQPPTGDSQIEPSVYGATRLSIDGPFGTSLNVMTYIENIDIEPYTGIIDVLLLDDDNNIAANLGSNAVTVPGFDKGFAGTLLFNPKNISSEIKDVPDGNYTIRLGYRTADTDNAVILRHPKGLPAYAIAKVSRGALSITGKHVPAPDCVLLSAITTDGALYAGGNSMVQIAMENRSADFVLSDITLRLTSVEDPQIFFDTTVSKTIYEQSTEQFYLSLPVDAAVPAGEYTLTALVKNDNGEYLFDNSTAGETRVKVLPAAAGPVVRTASQMAWKSNNADAPAGYIAQGETFYGVITLRNASTAGTANVLARFINQATGESHPFYQASVDFSDAVSQTVTFGRYLPFDPGTYTVELYQVEPGTFAETPVEGTYQPLTVTISASDNLMAEMLSLDIPAKLTQGERVSCSFKYRGLDNGRQNIYIRLRQFSNSGGEIAYMGSQQFVPGEERDVTFNYRPSTTLADGLYMVIAESGNTSMQIPLGNYANYGRVVTIGNVSSLGIVEALESSIAIWAEGRTLHVHAAGDSPVSTIAVYTPAGAQVSANTTDLSGLVPGIYIVRATLSNGHSATAKVAIR